MYKLDIQNCFVHSVCYTDSWSHLREREREYYCHSQDVHIVADTKKCGYILV